MIVSIPNINEYSKKKDIIKKSDSKKIEYMGYYEYYYYFFSKYLITKYSDIVYTEPGFIINYQYGNLALNNKTNLNLDSKIKTEFISKLKNNNKQYIVILITIYGHAMSLLYDTKKSEIELFEPYGSQNWFYFNVSLKFVYKEFISSLKSFFSSFLPDYKFFESVNFFPPGKGFQNFEIEVCNESKYKINSTFGFCTAWSMWYMELRIKNKNIPREKLVKDTILLFEKDLKSIENNTKINPKICEVIRNFTKFLIKLDSNKSPLKRKLLFLRTLKEHNFLVKIALNFGNILFDVDKYIDY